MELEIKHSGEIPRSRFGHTCTVVSNNMVMLFGGALGDTGQYEITNECYSFTMNDCVWKKVETSNNIGQRAAHAACRLVDRQLLVYGGATGGGKLADDNIYLLDLTKNGLPSWELVPLVGPNPGCRYGHSLVYCKPFVICYGGNDGTNTIGDVWYMNAVETPFRWVKIEFSANAVRPCPRVYHSADVCNTGPADGMMVVYGGRSADGRSLNDIWGLRLHRSGNWEWLQAPIKQGPRSEPRYQHCAMFYDTKLIIVGGRADLASRPLSTVVYDTATCVLITTESISRFRHSSWLLHKKIFTFGGFDHVNQTTPTGGIRALDFVTAFHEIEASFWNTYPQPEKNESALGPIRTSSSPIPVRAVRLDPHVITIVGGNDEHSSNPRRVKIDHLPDEARRIRSNATCLTPIHALREAYKPSESISDVIAVLMWPDISERRFEEKFSSGKQFALTKEVVSSLILQCTNILAHEPTLISVRAPIKVFGDIHGQYFDLMRLFAAYGSPAPAGFSCNGIVNGDLHVTDYLFLGDFVDRGTNSLEVICLLMALKIAYPEQVHLIRGNHEDSAINSVYGFKVECTSRLLDNSDGAGSIWNAFNRMFEYLPLGAVIDNKILCVHGGIGSTIHSIRDIQSIPKPISVQMCPHTEEAQRVTDLLWSDPTDNDEINGIENNSMRDPEDSGKIVRYGPDRVIEFTSANQLDLIIRAHECVMDGFERFAAGRLITVFSATDYCNSHGNAGAILFITKNLTVQPKTIYPLKANIRLPDTSRWLDLEGRPPTPLRGSRNIH